MMSAGAWAEPIPDYAFMIQKIKKVKQSSSGISWSKKIPGSHLSGGAWAKPIPDYAFIIREVKQKVKECPIVIYGFALSILIQLKKIFDLLK